MDGSVLDGLGSALKPKPKPNFRFLEIINPTQWVRNGFGFMGSVPSVLVGFLGRGFGSAQP